MEKAQRKMTVIRVEDNKNEKQRANGFVYKLKVRVEGTDRDGDPTLEYKRMASKVKPEKLGVATEYEIEYGTFVPDSTIFSFDPIICKIKNKIKNAPISTTNITGFFH